MNQDNNVTESKGIMFNYDSSLEAFIRNEFYRQQKENPNKDQIDSIKINQFFERALSETRRMNDAIKNSHKQRNLLRKEFGLRMLSDWLKEHQTEILEPFQEKKEEK
ncbi:uncharacterized protein LOC106878685 [Octopus bimaculoides]|uniref:Uncharacterized protein n=1 Tax=Octopus bimaculoides TaxID=37653 RepID=A0A0L8G8C9_OCTBM|nr:uncharacterized protein LOC106878685 [Octopus bimaculoides]|eukprot:XP_014783455.1 PREDICTED: uncharacterized protein LOC106878685 [Octopus bimaculoides]